ncbi:MAG: hypothetical protein HZY78_14305 [Burkholderiaceae bacterium]|nr:MAG: hypothetical protein HZY78_14305 [Burkholderiaceae bacterium]
MQLFDQFIVHLLNLTLLVPLAAIPTVLFGLMRDPLRAADASAARASARLEPPLFVLKLAQLLLVGAHALPAARCRFWMCENVTAWEAAPPRA